MYVFYLLKYKDFLEKVAVAACMTINMHFNTAVYA